MIEKASVLLSKLVYGVLFAFSIIVVALSINSFFNPNMRYNQLNMNCKILAGILLLLFIAFLFFVVKKTYKMDDNILIKSYRYYSDVVVIFLSAFCFRLCFLFLYGNSISPFSDFQQAHATALGAAAPLNYDLFPSWAFFSIILRSLYHYTIPHFSSAQLLNAAVTSVTAVLIYILAHRIIEKRSIALVSAIIFTSYPANILYNAILTPEHLAILLSCIIILLLTGNQQSNIRYCLYCGVAGILCAFMNYMKPMAVVLLIAYTITSILDYFINHSKKIKLLILPLFILVAAYSLSSFAVERYTEKKLEIHFTGSSNTTAHFLYVGLQPTGEGQIHMGDNPRKYYTFLEQTGRDYTQAKVLTYIFLKQKIRENPKQFVLLFPKKFRWAWQDDTTPSYYIWNAVKGNTDLRTQRLSRITEKTFFSVSQIFYILLIAFSSYGLFFIIKRRFNYTLFLMSLYCFGFICLLLISEAQSRYKCMITPFLCILAANGIIEFYPKFKTVLKASAIKIGRCGHLK